MSYLWIGLAAGLAATPHCLGMCGAFPLHLARAGRRGALQHALFSIGRMCSYAFLGAFAGFVGYSVLHDRQTASLQYAFSYLMGTIMLVTGIAMLGLLPRFRSPALLDPVWRTIQPLHRALLKAPGPGGALALGIGVGLLPCPATLALCAGAAATHSVTSGMALLAGLGMGSAPALLAVGLSGALVAPRLRVFGLRGVGLIVVVLGLTTALRPTGVICQLLGRISWGQ